MQSSSFMKTPFKELRPDSEPDSADPLRNKQSGCWNTPKTLSSTAK